MWPDQSIIILITVTIPLRARFEAFTCSHSKTPPPRAANTNGKRMRVMAKSAFLRLNQDDNVIVAIDKLAPGTNIEGEGVTVASVIIPAGHKVAAAAIRKGEVIRKYGQVIGVATADIAPGEHVHVHNVACEAVHLEHKFGSQKSDTLYFPKTEVPTFNGFVRADGRVGTRNYIGVISTVNCSATVTRRIADAFKAPGMLDAFPNVDGVIGLTHSSGCGLNTNGEPADVIRRTIAGYARHPNFAGVVVVGLGCEDNNLARMMEVEKIAESDSFHPLVIQECGGSVKTTAEGIERVKAMLIEANKLERRPVPASELILALQCGGSDGYSGISANPALGAAADLLVRCGGTVCLSETSEVYGAEHLLTSRAVSDDVAEKLLARIRWWEDYVGRNGGEMNNNPSPGNKAGGLTTILEKSLGAVAKGGTTNLTDVLGFAEPIRTKGFVFMDGPGYDPMSVTGEVAGGSNIACFTTGRGSCFGCKPTPSLKLATNSEMFARMEDDMDVNCGQVVDGTKSVAEMGEEIFRKILVTASGEKSKSEVFGYGEDEFLPWHIGFYM